MSAGLDAIGVADAIADGELSAAEVMAATLARLDESTELNAFVHVAPRDELAAAADAIDRARVAGATLGPFAGVPIAVKDIEGAIGMPTTHGSMIGSDEPAAADSPHVARLRSAGAIVVGKTNTPEFAYSVQTRNRRFGLTRNPADPERAVGGSSGGSAAAVAARIVPLATASDGGGSIRIPATFCGLPGLKPTFGRIPAERDGWTDLTHTGALTATLRDQARYLDVCAGPDAAARLALPPPCGSFEAAMSEPLDIAGLRAAVFPTVCGAAVDGDVEAAVATAVGQLGVAGVALTEHADDLPDVRRAFTDLASYVEGDDSLALGADELAVLTRGYREWCERGRAVTVSDLVSAQRVRERLFARIERALDGADVLLCPAVGILPWRLDDPPAADPLEWLLTHPFNLTGHPALVLPLPGVLAGLQVIGRRFAEADLLRAGVALAEALR